VGTAVGVVGALPTAPPGPRARGLRCPPLMWTTTTFGRSPRISGVC